MTSVGWWLPLATMGAILLTWTGLLCVQVLACAAVWRKEKVEDRPEVARLAVVMPAHNEALVIADSVRALRTHMRAQDTLLVVADNCDDDTARLARLAGAEVVERHDENLRGKGYALAHGIAHLASQPPDVLLVIDADCRVEAAGLFRLAATAADRQRPVQGLYLMRAPKDGGLKVRMAAFAWALRNHVRALGYAGLGLPCQLMGSGMAFPWPLVERVSFATGHIVEDVKLGLSFGALGAAPVFCPSVTTASEFPSNDEGAASQRKRWEHGHLSVLMRDVPAYLAHAVRNRNLGLFAMALDMSVPPLALLAALSVVFLLLCAAATWWFATWLPLAMGLLVCGLLLAAVGGGWWLVGRAWVKAHELFFVPIYVLRKLPLYVAFLFKRQVVWVKTRREKE
jgi:glycosyltransferase involved in cell wall biosynthesis